MGRPRIPPDEKEVAFHEALASYRTTGEQRYRDEVFFFVQEACYAMAKKLLGAVRTQDFSGKVLDATLAVVARLDKNREQDTPRKLVTFCYPYVLKALYHHKIINEERQVRLPENFENYSSLADFRYASELGEVDFEQFEEN